MVSADASNNRLYQLSPSEPCLGIVQPVIHNVIRVFLRVVVQRFKPLLAGLVISDLQELKPDLQRLSIENVDKLNN